MTEFRYVTLEGIADNCSGAIKIGPFGSELKKEDMSASGPRVYGQEDVIAGDFSAEVRRISLRKFQGLAQFELKPGDVVVTMMGSIGHCAVFPNYAEQGIMDSHLLRVRPDRKLMISEFLAVLLSYSGTVAQISQLAHGSIMSGLNSRIVRSLTSIGQAV